MTLWCRDLLTPIDSSQPYVIFPVWQDIFYHWRHISGFAQSAGASTIDDVRMAGVVAHPYHFASYVVPALMVGAADVSEWVAYASFLVPVGILLTFLAAYALVAPVFGAWPAAVGALALLVLPDAFQQGFGNPFLSYHWLQQVVANMRNAATVAQAAAMAKPGQRYCSVFQHDDPKLIRSEIADTHRRSHCRASRSRSYKPPLLSLTTNSANG